MDYCLIRICAWCGKMMGKKQVKEKPEKGQNFTHGICEDCMRAMEEQYENK